MLGISFVDLTIWANTIFGLLATAVNVGYIVAHRKDRKIWLRVLDAVACAWIAGVYGSILLGYIDAAPPVTEPKLLRPLVPLLLVLLSDDAIADWHRHLFRRRGKG